MTVPFRIRLMVDECLGGPAIAGLRDALRDRLELEVVVETVVDRIRSGTPDEQWIPRIASDGFIVVTADRGRHSGRLPMICREQGVTAVIICGALAQAKMAVKANALIDRAEKLLEVQRSASGTQYRLTFSNRRQGYQLRLHPPQRH